MFMIWEQIKRLTQNDVRHFSTAGVPVDGVSGTGVNDAGKGSLCTDYTNGKLYINGGTKTSPLWKIVTSA